MTYKIFPLQKKNFLLKFIIGLLTVFVSFLTSIYVISFILGPPSIMSDQNTIYFSQNDQIIGEERGMESRYWVDIDHISPHIINAVIAMEDKSFFNHHGFSLKRMIGAAWRDLQSLSLKEGASTLTQQYARNLFLTHEKTLTRKLKEAFYTIRLEMHYSKEEILEGYLNTIYFGHGAYGIEAASRHFFGKQASEVSIAEAAMLAGIPKGPTYYSPFNDLSKATERQQIILKQLLQQQFITKDDYDRSLAEKLDDMHEKKQPTAKIGPYFQDAVLHEAANILQLDQEDIKSGGYQIYTTLLPHLQQSLENQINGQISQTSTIEIGAIALEPQTGAVLALVGGRSYDNSPFNRAITAKRMAGSTFKPFLYYAALNHGYTASTKLMSEPTVFTLGNNETYQPSNFNGYYAHQPITLAQSLALSDNIYAVKTNVFLGAERLANTAREFGITSDLPAVPSLALGTASISVQEMTTAYGMIANGGYDIESYTIKRIVDRHGNTVFKRDEKIKKQIFDQVDTFLLTQLMTGMFDQSLNGYMPVTGTSIMKLLTRPYAGKSGTTDADSWMIGYSPSLVTGIWTGYDDNRPIESAEENAYAKKIWAAFMEEAHDGMPIGNFPVPAGVTRVQIDPETGEIATPYCSVKHSAYYRKGTEPVLYCQTHLPINEGKPEHQEDRLFKRLFDWLPFR